MGILYWRAKLGDGILNIIVDRLVDRLESPNWTVFTKTGRPL